METSPDISIFRTGMSMLALPAEMTYLSNRSEYEILVAFRDLTIKYRKHIIHLYILNIINKFI